MSDVKYSLNGKYFKSFGVYVESSKGLLDRLKPRDRQSYVWAEYPGKQIDLSPPKYDARDIVLTCFIKGDNIQKMTEQYNMFMSEVDKSGTQRLIVEPFGYKPFVFDVIITDKSELEKEFRDGEMFGKFSISIQEPNPIKKILYTTNAQLSIAYNSATETDIIIDGVRYQGKELVNFTKNLTPRTIMSNDTYKRNLLVGKLFLTGSDYPTVTTRDPGKITILSNSVFNAYQFITPTVRGKAGDKYTISMEVKVSQIFANLILSFFAEYPANLVTKDLKTLPIGEWTKIIVTSNTLVNTQSNIGVVLEGKGSVGSSIEYRNFKLEIGQDASDYSPAPEDQHYINIAGNIEDLANFTTNAEVLWNKI